MNRRRSPLPSLVAALLVLATCVAVVEGPVAAPAASPTCQGRSESRQPVLLVHGFNSDSRVWNASKNTLADSKTCIETFDYGPDSTDWVTNPAIGRRLGDQIHRLALASRSGAGTGKVIVVAHSMGGLATRCAVSPQCGGGDAAELRELITFGTPNHGTFLKAYGTSNLSDLLGPYLSFSGGCYGSEETKIPGLCKEIQALGTSAAGKAFTPGSAQLRDLPDIPDDVPDLAVAGSFPVTTNLFLHTFTVGDLGDLVVARESALSAARPSRGTGGEGSLVPCGGLDLVTGALTLRCWHGTETSYRGFVNQARLEITKIETIDRPDPAVSATKAARKKLCPDAIVSGLRVSRGFAAAMVRCPSAGGQSAAGFTAIFASKNADSMRVLASGSYIDPLKLLDLGIPLATQARLNGSGLATTRQNLFASCGESGYHGGDVPAFDGFGASFPPDDTKLDAATRTGLEDRLSSLIASDNRRSDSTRKVFCVSAVFEAGLRYTTSNNSFAMTVKFIAGDGTVSTHAVTFSTNFGRRSYTLDGRPLI